MGRRPVDSSSMRDPATPNLKFEFPHQEAARMVYAHIVGRADWYHIN